MEDASDQLAVINNSKFYLIINARVLEDINITVLDYVFLIVKKMKFYKVKIVNVLAGLVEMQLVFV